MVDGSPITDLNSTRRDILYLAAAHGSAVGQDLRRALDEDYDDEINNGRFYPALDGLIDRGYLEKEPINKRSNAYAITQQGRQAIASDIEWRVSNYEESALTD